MLDKEAFWVTMLAFAVLLFVYLYYVKSRKYRAEKRRRKNQRKHWEVKIKKDGTQAEDHTSDT